MEALLSESASKELVQGILEIATELAHEMLAKQQKQWLMQKEVYKEYECCAKDLESWERMGLKKRRQGKRWMYYRNDIEEILQQLKN